MWSFQNWFIKLTFLCLLFDHGNILLASPVDLPTSTCSKVINAVSGDQWPYLNQWQSSLAAVDLSQSSITFQIFSTGGVVDILFYSSTFPTANFCRFDGRQGFPPGYWLQNYGWPPSYPANCTSKNNIIPLTGWHNVTCIYSLSGALDVVVDNMQSCGMVDTTFHPNGLVYFGQEVVGGSEICFPAPTPIWPQFSYSNTVNFLSMHRESNVKCQSPNTNNSERMLWQFTTGDSIQTAPAVGFDGTVFASSVDGFLYALDGLSGSLKWKAQVFAAESSPALYQLYVYVGSSDGHMYALNAFTGSIVWTFKTGALICSSPVISSDGIVYIGSTDYNVYALNSTTGVKIWNYSTGNSIVSSPTISAFDDHLYIGSNDHYLYSFDRLTGVCLWKSQVANGPIQSSPAIGNDGYVYASFVVNGCPNYDCSTYACKVNSVTGSVDYHFSSHDGSSSDIGTPAISTNGDIFFAGLGDNRLYAFDGLSFSLKFTFEAKLNIVSSAALGEDGTIYFGSLDTNVYALDGFTGSVLWQYSTEAAIQSSPAIGSNGVVYVGGFDGNVYAFKC